MDKEILKNKFKNASLKLRKSRLLKIFVLSSILLSHGKLNSDLIAEEYSIPQTETFVENPGITIECKDSDECFARYLKKIIYDFEDDNETTKILVKSLEKYNITLEIGEKSDTCNGSYIIGKDRIIIPYNVIEEIYNERTPIQILRLKRTLAHETTHMLQDKKGIFNDASQLSPLDCSIVYTFAELDAICKSYIATEGNFWTTNSAFDCLNNMIPCLDSYTRQGFYIGKLTNIKNFNLTLEDIVEKFNNEGFEDYENINEMINITKEKIRTELMSEMLTENEKFTKEITQNEVIASKNYEKE